MTPAEMITGAVTSGVFGAIAGSWGNDFAKADYVDEAVNLTFKSTKGLHPSAKGAIKATRNSAWRKTGRQAFKSSISGSAESASFGVMTEIIKEPARYYARRR